MVWKGEGFGRWDVHQTGAAWHTRVPHGSRAHPRGAIRTKRDVETQTAVTTVSNSIKRYISLLFICHFSRHTQSTKEIP